MGVTAYVAALLLFVAVTVWCWATGTFTVRRLVLLVLLTVTQGLLAIYIDYPFGLAIAAIFLGVEIFILVDLYEGTRW